MTEEPVTKTCPEPDTVKHWYKKMYSHIKMWSKGTIMKCDTI